MKIIVSNPALGAFVVLLGCNFLADTTEASNPRILRGQLHKNNNNNKPSRRRHVQVKAEAPLKETTLKEDAPVKAATIEPPLKEEKKTKTTSDSSMLNAPPPEPKQLHKGTPESSMNLGHLLKDKEPRETQTLAPAMTPIVDEDLLDSDGGNKTEVVDEGIDSDELDDFEVQDLFFETSNLHKISSSTVISGCITANVIAFLFLYQNAL